VRWEKVHAVKSAIASGHYDVEGRLMRLFDRLADGHLLSDEES
jgi:anti-sigma28 factor (negative regulator of flagellin synthesis)